MIKTRGCATRTSVLWLSPADLQAFGDALQATMPGLHWQCSHVGDERGQSRPHPTLTAALQCPHGSLHNPFSQQASVWLPVQPTCQDDSAWLAAEAARPAGLSAAADGAAHQVPRPVTGSLGLLLLNVSPQYPKHVVPARDFNPSTNLADWPSEFHEVAPSSLGITWDWADGDEASRAAMDTQVNQVWRTLHRVTQRVTVQQGSEGKSTLPARYRIGPHMASLMRDNGWCLRDGCLYRLAR